MAMVVSSIEGYAELQQQDPVAAELASSQTLDLMRLTGRPLGAYGCGIAQDRACVAFPSASAAIQFCLTVQEGLLQATWVSRVLQHPACKPSMSPVDGSLLFSGPRVKMGVAFGKPEEIRPDAVTARSAYRGLVVSRAAQMSQYIAHGGQIITDLRTAQAALKDWLGESLPIPAEGEIITVSAGHVKGHCSSTALSQGTDSEATSVESSRNLSLSSQSPEQSALKELHEGPARQRFKGTSVTAGAAQLSSPHQQPGLVTGPGTGSLAPSIMRKHPFQPPNKLPLARTEQYHSSNRPPAQQLSPMAAAAQAARLAFGQASSSSSSRGSAAPPAAGAPHERDQLQGLQGIMQHPRISPQRSDPSVQADSPLPSESRQLGSSKQAVPSGPRTVQSGSEENKLPAGADPSPAGEASPSLTLPASATPEKRKAGRKAGKQDIWAGVDAVEFSHLGTFTTKESPASLLIIQAATAHLAWRSFPVRPAMPKRARQESTGQGLLFTILQDENGSTGKSGSPANMRAWQD